MEPPQNQPIYWDKHRIPVNITLIFALVVAVFGLFQGAEGWLLVVAGLGVAAFSWFTNPRQYWIYQDALVIVYGRPRNKVIPFQDISRIEMRALATPDRLRVWQMSGKRVVLMARDPEAFHERLEQAVEDYRREHPEQMSLEGDPEIPENQENRDNA